MDDQNDAAYAGEDAAPGPDAFLSGLTEDQRAFAADNGWRNAESVFSDFHALQDQLSSAVMLPGESASSDEKAAFYQDVSKSWTPENGYRFDLPEGLAEDFPYDQAFAEEASGWFQEAGLHPEAAQKLHDRWVGKMADHFAANTEAAHVTAQKQAETTQAAHQALIKEYGAPESDGYQNVVAKADRAMTGLKANGIDLSGWFSEKGALTAAGADGLQQVADPTAVKLLAFIHDSALAEDGLPGLNTGGNGTNPFASDSLSLKEQSEMLERNPAKARQMILAAGRDPALFRL